MSYKEFTDEDLKVYWKIGEVAEEFNIATSALRYYEMEFDWIQPKKNKKGVRQFTRDDKLSLARVNYLISYVGMTIAGVRKAYDSGYLERIVGFFKKNVNEQRRLF